MQVLGKSMISNGTKIRVRVRVRVRVRKKQTLVHVTRLSNHTHTLLVPLVGWG